MLLQHFTTTPFKNSNFKLCFTFTPLMDHMMHLLSCLNNVGLCVQYHTSAG